MIFFTLDELMNLTNKSLEPVYRLDFSQLSAAKASQNLQLK